MQTLSVVEKTPPKSFDSLQPFEVRTSKRKLPALGAGIAFGISATILSVWLQLNTRESFFELGFVLGCLLTLATSVKCFQVYAAGTYCRYTFYLDHVELTYRHWSNTTVQVLPYQTVRLVTLNQEVWDKPFGVASVFILADLQGMVIRNLTIEDAQKVSDFVTTKISIKNKGELG